MSLMGMWRVTSMLIKEKGENDGGMGRVGRENDTVWNHRVRVKLEMCWEI